MKLVKQVQLFLQEGSSDKVYEIDLCETAPNEFVVNFRYGRRGGPLKEGTKTVFPVPLAEAEKAFKALEQEKRKKGYSNAEEVPIQEDFVREKPNPNDKRRKAIMKALRQSAAGEEPENWKLSRIIWRAGELKMEEAEASILKLADPSDEFTMYSAVWALARCGGQKSVPYLQKVYEDKSLKKFILSLIEDALLVLATPELRTKLLNAELQKLPATILEPIQANDYKKLSAVLNDYLFNLKTTSNGFLIPLYRLSLDDAQLRAVFLKVLRDLPFKQGTFLYLRQIFKASVMREDGDVYGILARNIERFSGSNNVSYWADEEEKANGAFTFTNKTKEYLKRRIFRDLRKFGEAQTGYVELATSVLLAYDDKQDGGSAYVSHSYRYDQTANNGRGRWISIPVDHDTYSFNLFFSEILYKNSPRYKLEGSIWECIPPYKPGDSAPSVREEAYPHLWDEAPDHVIRLLAESRTSKVHEFARRVYAANPEFEKRIKTEHIKAFLLSGFADTARLGYTMALKIYQPSNPDKNLVLALLESGLKEAVDTAGKWVNDQRELFFGDTTFLTALVLSQSAQAHERAKEWLSAFPIKGSKGEEVVAKVLSVLLNEPEYATDESKISSIAEVLLLGFEEAVKGLHLDVIKSLILHRSTALQSLGARMLLKNRVQAEDLPETFIMSLLSSDNAVVRAIGLEIIGQLSHTRLVEKKNLLVSLLVSPLSDLRSNVRPILDKLIRNDATFAKELADLLIPALLMNETYEGVHEDIRKLLTGEMLPQLSYLDKKKVLALLHSRNAQAQLLGYSLLKSNIKPSEITTSELVKLAANPILEVREYVWSIFTGNKDRIRKDRDDALKLCDNYWEDSRTFAFSFFRENFTQDDWTPQLLISLCDSVKQDVQSFGREMITKAFQSQDGEYYLLSLCQHPENRMAMFATNYLEQYAGGRPEIIEKLEAFFITLLSQVNKGRVAKSRVLAFLHKESLKSEVSANVATRIINNTSASVSIQDKATCVSMLLELKMKYPDLNTVIKIKEVPDYINE